jgi:predicted RNA-binding Zn-ribbon protein involved in translation (DUF1610 family)
VGYGNILQRAKLLWTRRKTRLTCPGCGQPWDGTPPEDNRFVLIRDEVTVIYCPVCGGELPMGEVADE